MAPVRHHRSRKKFELFIFARLDEAPPHDFVFSTNSDMGFNVTQCSGAARVSGEDGTVTEDYSSQGRMTT